jgi:hypothetical protein
VSSVARIITGDGDRSEAVAGEAVTLTLTDAVDVSRADVLCSADAPCDIADQFKAHLAWMDTEPLLPGRRYLLRLGTQTASAQVTAIKHKVNVNTLEHTAGRRLDLNEVAAVNLALDRVITFETYVDSRELGGFVLIDRMGNGTVACVMIDFALRRAANTQEALARSENELPGLPGRGRIGPAGQAVWPRLESPGRWRAQVRRLHAGLLGLSQPRRDRLLSARKADGQRAHRGIQCPPAGGMSECLLVPVDGGRAPADRPMARRMQPASTAPGLRRLDPKGPAQGS